MGRESVFNDHHRSVFETASGCLVCDGPQSWYKPLGDWICTKRECGASNRPHNARCFKKCGGLPEPDHIDGQAEAQRAHKGLKPGAAPYIPPGKRAAAAGANAKAKAESPEAKRIREQAAKIKKQDEELKKLRAGGGGGGHAVGKSDDAADPKAVKELENKLKDAKTMAAKFPDEKSCAEMVAKFEAQLLEARPPKAVQTSELQKQLEDCEKAIKEAEEKDTKKQEFIAKKYQEVTKQRLAIAQDILQNRAKIKVIAAQFAERTLAAPAAANAQAPAELAPQLQMTAVPAFLASTKAELDVACGNGALLSDPTKENIKTLSDGWQMLEKLCALLVDTKSAVTNELSYAHGVASTQMPPAPVGQQQPAPHTLLDQNAPPAIIVPKGFSNTVPPVVADEFLDLDADDFMFEDEKAAAEAGGWDPAQQWVGGLKVDSLQKLLAMAEASNAQAQDADQASAASGEK